MMMNNEKGLTLIEILAAISLLSIILLLAGSVQLFGQKQVDSQVTDIQNQSDVRLALDILTNDIRSATGVSAANNILTISTATNSTNIYQLNGTSLTKNSQTIITGIGQFIVNTNPSHITITISSNSAPPTTLTTTIYYREAG